MKLTLKEKIKLGRALKMAMEAQILIDSVVNSNDSYRYSSNTNILSSRIEGVVSVLTKDVNNNN